MPNRILAIDPGTRCGWARLDGAQVESGVWDFSGPQSWGAKWSDFHARLMGKTTALQAQTIVCEDQTRIRGRYALLCWGWQVMVMALAAQQHMELLVVNPATLKKWATGSGKASKDEMVRATNAQMAILQPYTGRRRAIWDDNEADALLLLAWAREQG